MFRKKWKNHPYKFVTKSNDNNGNGSVFLDIYDIVWQDTPRHKKEHLLSIDYEEYCIKNIHGLEKVYSIFTVGVFSGVEFYFKDEASLSWFLLRWL